MVIEVKVNSFLFYPQKTCRIENILKTLTTLNVPGARIYRLSFHENKPKTLVFSHTKRAFWACFRENWIYNFGHGYRTVCRIF
jgi:hypothetical protein